MTQKKTLTVIVRETSSPYPPVAPWPLIYTVESVDPEDHDDIRGLIAAQRLDDMGGVADDEDEDEQIQKITDGLELLFAFEGDLILAQDWRE